MAGVWDVRLSILVLICEEVLQGYGRAQGSAGARRSEREDIPTWVLTGAAAAIVGCYDLDAVVG